MLRDSKMHAFLLGHRDLLCAIKVLKQTGNFSEPITGLALNHQMVLIKIHGKQTTMFTGLHNSSIYNMERNSFRLSLMSRMI